MLSRLGRFASSLARSVSPADRDVINTLKTKGYHVVPGFLDAETCGTLRQELDDLMSKHAGKLQHEHSEGTSGDYRLFGAEAESPMLRERFALAPWLRDIGRAYLDEDIVTHFTMANKVEFVPGQVTNSGAGWHRDSASRQFKAIVYLTDVGPENGPFTIVPGSRDAGLSPRANARNNNRFDDETVAAFVKRSGSEMIEITGRAGTCILVDTSHVHRGKDIQAGVRYAVTNYYFRDTLEKRRKNQEKWGRHLLQPIA
jgi:hypothetical protein